MLTYEEVSHLLLATMYDSELYPYNIENHLELNSLFKEFKCNCVLEDQETPHFLRAEINLGWDAYFTANSVYGKDCFFYHDETVECIHEETEPSLLVELEIRYNIEVVESFERDFDRIYHELMNVFRSNMDHDNLPAITWKVTAGMNGKLHISFVEAQHFWEIDINDEDLDVSGIFEEVKENLISLAQLPFIKK